MTNPERKSEAVNLLEREMPGRGCFGERIAKTHPRELRLSHNRYVATIDMESQACMIATHPLIKIQEAS